MVKRGSTWYVSSGHKLISRCCYCLSDLGEWLVWDGECVELFLGGLFPMCHETSMVLRCMAEELCQRAQNMWFCFIPLAARKITLSERDRHKLEEYASACCGRSN